MLEFKQDLYYGNMPVDRKLKVDNLGFLRNYLLTSFLKDFDNPYFIWTGTGYIEKLDKKFLLKKTFNKLRKQKIYFFLYEPMSLYLEGESFNRGFYSEFKDDVEYNKIRSDELDSISKFANKHNLNIVVCTGDYNCEFLEQHYSNLKIKCLDIFLRHQSPSYSKSIVPEEYKIGKKFWCGNWRYTAHRHIIAAYMTNTDSIISWHVNAPGKILKELNWFDYNSINNQKIIDGVKLLREKTYSIDYEKLTPEEVTGIDDLAIPGDGQPSLSQELSKSYLRSFCAVVTETRFAQPTANISEKTIMAMFHNRPFIIVAPPNTLDYIKDLGFKTFDKWWDEEYDKELNHQIRILKILDLIETINSKTIIELRTIYKDMKDVLQHNKKILEKLSLNDQFSNSFQF